MSKKSPILTEENKKEIVWNVINSILAGFLVLVGNFMDGRITVEGVVAAIAACIIVMVTSFKKYWDSEEKEYCTKMFKFLPL